MGRALLTTLNELLTLRARPDEPPRNRPDGSLSGISAQSVAEMSLWMGLLAAMIAAETMFGANRARDEI